VTRTGLRANRGSEEWLLQESLDEFKKRTVVFRQEEPAEMATTTPGKAGHATHADVGAL